MRISRGLSGFLSRRCLGLSPCLESEPEPEDFSAVLTWILGYFSSIHRGVSPRLEWGNARALSSRAVAAVSCFPSLGSRDLCFPSRLFSRLITSNLWNVQRVLHTLAATQEVPRHTRLHTRGSTRVLPTSRGPRFCLLAREEGSFPFVVGKEFPAVPSHLTRRHSPQERREELQGRATIPRVPQMSQSILEETVFPVLPRLSSRGSTHTTVARGTALWESLVGNPLGKASSDNHRSLDACEGKRDTAATAREESARACPHSSRGLTPLGRLQKSPKIHVGTGEESSGSGTNSTQGLRPRHRRERNPERSPGNSHRDWPFLRPPERVPEVPIVSREHLPQLEKIQVVFP